MVLGLESAVFQQDHLIGYGWKDLQPMGRGEVLRNFVYDGLGEEDYDGSEIFNPANWGHSTPQNHSASVVNVVGRSLPENDYGMNKVLVYGGGSCPMEAPVAKRGRRKRRRAKVVKNSEEIENQRMTHIAVERNRRKLMNEYLSMLRSMMPSSYTQRVML